MDKIRLAKEKRVRRKLRNLGVKHKEAQAILESNHRFIGTKHVGTVDDAEYGSKPPQMSLLEARAKLCNQQEELCGIQSRLAKKRGEQA